MGAIQAEIRDPPGGMAGVGYPRLSIVRAATSLGRSCKGAWAPKGDSPGSQDLAGGCFPGESAPKTKGQKKKGDEGSMEKSSCQRGGA